MSTLLSNIFSAGKRTVKRTEKPPPADGLLQLRKYSQRLQLSKSTDDDYQSADENTEDDEYRPPLKGIAACVHVLLMQHNCCLSIHHFARLASFPHLQYPGIGWALLLPSKQQFSG